MGDLYLFILAFVIFVFIAPVFLKVRMTCNVFKNTGVMAVYLFGVNVLSLKFKFTHNGIILFDGEDVKEKTIHDLKKGVITKNLILQIKDKVKLKTVEFYYNLGVGDAFYTALLCGCINSSLLGFFTRLKSSKPTTSFFVGDNPSYNEVVFQTSLKIKLSISLFDLVYSFVNSVILTSKDNIL